MNITALAHRAIRKLVLMGLLFFPFALTPSYATELVGKPVAVGRHSAAVASSTPASQETQSIDAPPATPAEPTLPEEVEPPQAPDLDSARDDIEHAMDEMRDSFNDHNDTDFSGFLMNPDTLIPIVAMLLLFGGPVLLVIILAILHYRSKARRQKNININIDKLLAAGRDIPIELLMGDEPRAIKSTTDTGAVIYTEIDATMRKGVRNICLGIGWLIFLTIAFGIEIGAFGFIFIGLGVSQIIIWKLSGNRPNHRTITTDSVKVQD